MGVILHQKWDKSIEDLRDLVNYPNEITEKRLCKEIISDTNYNPIISGINMMEPPDNIEKVKSDIRKWREKIKCKHKFMAIRNSRMTIEYMDYYEPG